MKTHPRSWSVTPLFVVLVLSLSCSLVGRRNKEGTQVPAALGPVEEEEVSLSEDRRHLEDLRTDIPEEKRERNDEFAFIMKLMGEIKSKPYEVRSKFNREVRKRRERFNRIMRKKREAFRKEQKKLRDDFQKKMKEEREEFTAGKHSREEISDFYNEVSEKQNDFYAEQRDVSRTFNMEMNEERREWEERARERRRQFDEEHRKYSKRYGEYEKKQKEYKKLKREVEKRTLEKHFENQMERERPPVKAAPGFERDLKEFDEIPDSQGEWMGAGDGN
jgi:hypothetical protein